MTQSKNVLQLNQFPPAGCRIEHVFSEGYLVGFKDMQSGTVFIVKDNYVHIVAGEYKVMGAQNFNEMVELTKCLMDPIS